MSARKKGVTTRDLHALDLAVRSVITPAFPPEARTYLVGTALTGPYRDVDVRTMLTDDLFAEFFPTEEFWGTFCFLACEWLSAQTRLPIDYQVQSFGEANRFDGPRNPLGMVRSGARLYAGGGDATPFRALRGDA
jgi:hypothetical protein